MSYATLLLALTGMLIFQAPLGAAGFGSAMLFLFSLAVLATAAVAASDTPRLRRAALGLMVLPITGETLARLISSPAILIADAAAGAAYLIFVSAVILRNVFGRDRPTRDAVLGGVCVYLLIGFSFYLVFCLVEIASPGAFLARGAALVDYGGTTHPLGRYPDLLYFSYVTITTLGYGDIVPVGPFARSLATAAAVTGQLYLAILMAGLVGMHLAGRGER